MHPVSPPELRNRRAGFTLSEILLAMLVFAIAISTILALLARSIEAVDEIVLKDEAMRVSSAVEIAARSLSFNDFYTEVVSRSGTSSPMIVYAFSQRDVGPRAVFRSDNPIPPRYANLEPPIFLTSEQLRVAANQREGRIFKVTLTVSETNPAGNVNLPANPDQYESAVVVVLADFHPVGNIETPVPGPRVAHSYHFAVRR